jgi:hypothetical protein
VNVPPLKVAEAKGKAFLDLSFQSGADRYSTEKPLAAGACFD